MSEDGVAGFWRADDPLHARQRLPGAEVVERISAVLPKPGNFSGERGQPGAGRRGEVGEAGVGGGEGRFPAAGWDFDGSDREVAA